MKEERSAPLFLNTELIYWANKSVLCWGHSVCGPFILSRVRFCSPPPLSVFVRAYNLSSLNNSSLQTAILQKSVRKIKFCFNLNLVVLFK